MRNKKNISRKRRLAISKVWEKYGNDISVLDIKKYLKTDYGTEVTRQQLYHDIEWLKDNKLDAESEGDKNLLLEVSYAELKTQYKEARDAYDSTSDSGEKLQWSKRMTDISKLKRTVEKELDELHMMEAKASEKAIVYNVWIGKPKVIDPVLYAKKQAELREKVSE